DETGVLLRRGLSDAEIIDAIGPADVIGFGLMFSQDWLPARELIARVRAAYPNGVLVGGGEHFTAEPIGALEDSCLDFVLEGEGDRSVCDLLEHLAGKRPLADVPGCWYRAADGTIQRTTAKVRVRDVDSLPWPAWDLVPVATYLDGGHMIGVDRGRSMPMNATRGCPYQCTFCSSPAMWTTRYVTRTPEHVADEIGNYVERYGVSNIDFHDLTSMLTKKWIVRFCDVMEERGLKISWQLPSGTRCEALDAEALSALYRSGCRNLSYSPESGSEEILKDIKKRVKLPVLMKSVRAAVEQGIIVNVN